MQIADFRTRTPAQHQSLPVATPVRPGGSLVEYGRFVEVQQRRARIIAELERPAAAPAPGIGPEPLVQFPDASESETVDASIDSWTR